MNLFISIIFILSLRELPQNYGSIWFVGLCRSQAQLQKLGDELNSHIAMIGVYEEDLSIDIVSNAEDVGLPSIIKDNAEQNNASPHRKRMPVGHNAIDETKQGSTYLNFSDPDNFTVLVLKRPFFLLNQSLEIQIFQNFFC